MGGAYSSLDKMGNTGATGKASAMQISTCIFQDIALLPNVFWQCMRWPFGVEFPCVCTLSSRLLLLCHPHGSRVERTLFLYRSGMKSSSMVCTMRPPSKARRVLSLPLIPATPSSILAQSGLRTSASTSAMLACLQRNLRSLLCLLRITSDSSVLLCQTSVGHSGCHMRSKTLNM